MSLKRSCKDAAVLLGKALLKKGFTVSTAESCTGGMIGAVLTAVPGSSAWFRGGIIAYDNTIKISQLNVPENTIQKHGAVSEQTVAAMVQGVALRFVTECSIAVSGIAGPDGGTEEKPVGLVYIGIYSGGKTSVFRATFSGDREMVREQAAEAGIRGLMKQL